MSDKRKKPEFSDNDIERTLERFNEFVWASGNHHAVMFIISTWVGMEVSETDYQWIIGASKALREKERN